MEADIIVVYYGMSVDHSVNSKFNKSIRFLDIYLNRSFAQFKKRHCIK